MVSLCERWARFSEIRIDTPELSLPKRFEISRKLTPRKPKKKLQGEILDYSDPHWRTNREMRDATLAPNQ